MALPGRVSALPHDLTLVNSTMRSRSKSAIEPKTWKIRRPVGVVVSIASASERNLAAMAPLATVPAPLRAAIVSIVVDQPGAGAGRPRTLTRRHMGTAHELLQFPPGVVRDLDADFRARTRTRRHSAKPRYGPERPRLRGPPHLPRRNQRPAHERARARLSRSWVEKRDDI